MASSSESPDRGARLARQCDALLPKGLGLAPDRRDTSAVHGDPVWVTGDQPGARSCVAGLPVRVGSESRSDAIDIRRTRLAAYIRRLEENTPGPTMGTHDGRPVAAPRGRGRGRIICCRQRTSVKGRLPTARSESNDATCGPLRGWLVLLSTRAGDRRRSDSVSVPAAGPRWWFVRCLGRVRDRCAGGGTVLPAHQALLRPVRWRLALHRRGSSTNSPLSSFQRLL